MPTMKITRRSITAIKPAEKTITYYDDALPGFGLKVLPSGVQSWICEYRPGAGGRGVAKRRVVLGSVSVLSPEQARDAAQTLLARVRLGDDPSADRAAERADITVADLCDRYLAEGCDLKKVSTITTDRSRIERHIKPLLGHRRVREVQRLDIERFMRDVAAGKTARDVKTGKQGRSIVTGGKGAATRTVRLLGGIFTWAIAQKLRPDNPTVGVQKFPDASGERYLTSEEFGRLGEAIEEAETSGIPFRQSSSKHAAKSGVSRIDAHAASAIRLLVFTGCRVSEILNLRWAECDLERGLLFLPDSKTGRKTIVLSDAASAVLAEVPKLGVYVIAGETAGLPDERPRRDLKRPWALLCRRAGLEGVRLHDLRHSHASIGAGAGMGLPIIGKLLGHADPATTAKYAHLDADPVRRAANEIGSRIAAAMKRA
ncbi:integrase [Azorhizobium oxalatiphilum]|uniref:Integrase n=2 Tax=Azorhizobium oxalatiphilum TaxID=980631 RepID=A0A917C180_9HYPH|nr:integrase [Azorhizobium oxalatiphilum]